MADDRDLMIAGVTRLFDETEVAVLVDGAEAIAERSPRLSDEDIRAIADRVADNLLHEFEHRIPPSKQEHWKKVFAKLAYDLAIGVAASALWGALASLSHVFAYMDDGDAALAVRKQRREASLQRLVSRMPSDKAPEFVRILHAPWMTQAIIDEMGRAVAATGALGEVEQSVTEEFGRPPLIHRRTGAGWVGESLAVGLFYALEKEAACRVGEPPVS